MPTTPEGRKNNVRSSSAVRGYLLIVGAVLLWGGSASLVKHLFATKNYDTVTLVQMRSSLSFLMFAAYFAVRDRTVFRIERSDLKHLVLLGVFGMAVTNFAYYFTVREATIATAIIVQYTAPVLVMIYTVAISREETLNGIKLISLLLAMVGCFLAVSGGDVSAIQLRGWTIVTSISSAVCFAYLIVASKRILKKYSVWTMLTYAFGFATLFWLAVNPPWTIAAQGYTWADWGIFWMFAIVSILIPHTMFMASLNMLEASRVGIASTLEPVIAIVIAYLALGEALSGVQAVGALAVVAAILLLQVRPDLFARTRPVIRDGQ
ncbi:MAG: DMT family transporter [Bacteroidota bacterium]